ncbi:hypothetical protein [Methanohalophilus halophilus]|uniref:hypothetical protein n=1 Tax=Methanohalophilus halophilus TaxID=2177 RepID=UPI0012F6AA26|nr:hypothetical protein [Methanohalophilus halophilus]
MKCCMDRKVAVGSGTIIVASIMGIVSSSIAKKDEYLKNMNNTATDNIRKRAIDIEKATMSI